MAPPTPPTTIDTTMAAADWRALGTGVRLVVTRPRRLGAAKAAVDAVIAAIDATCSRFRDDSELSRLNARPDQATRVSPLLARAIAEALRGAQLTDGDVDPTVGTALRLCGYDRDFASLPLHGEALPLTLISVPGWQTIQFDPVGRCVRFPAGVELDLGATAKALAADLAAAAAHAAIGEGGVLVSLGGDIALAGPPPDAGWAVQVSDDSNEAIDASAEQITLHRGSVATSSTRLRRWRRGSAELHHIIDPRTGRPVDSRWQLATVVASTCVDANIASTAAIVRGDGAPAWLRSLGLPARLVDRQGCARRLAGWPRVAGERTAA